MSFVSATMAQPMHPSVGCPSSSILAAVLCLALTPLAHEANPDASRDLTWPYEVMEMALVHEPEQLQLQLKGWNATQRFKRNDIFEHGFTVTSHFNGQAAAHSFNTSRFWSNPDSHLWFTGSSQWRAIVTHNNTEWHIDPVTMYANARVRRDLPLHRQRVVFPRSAAILPSASVSHDPAFCHAKRPSHAAPFNPIATPTTRRRRAFCSGACTCPLVLVADHRFYQAIGGGSVDETAAIMVAAAADANRIYRQSSFGGTQGYGLSVGRCVIAHGRYIWHTCHVWTCSASLASPFSGLALASYPASPVLLAPVG